MCKMVKFLYIGLVFILQETTAEWTKYDFGRMPPMNHLDTFEHCLQQPRGVYCTAHADLVSDEPSELLDMLKAYSADRMKHFNRTKVTYGLCLQKTCRPFYSGGDDEDTLKTASEACLNHTFSEDYGLKTRVTELNCYFEYKSKYSHDWLDWAVLALAVGILALNAIGTAYDLNRDRTKPGNPYLTAFSLRVNWKSLVAPPPSNPEVALLNPLYGIRAMTSLLVILGHVPMPMAVAIVNPDNFESSYSSLWFHVLAQGHLITMTFFLISGFILIYNAQANPGKGTWKGILKAVIIRWLRLSPITIVCLLIQSTWMRFTTGPLWEEILGNEVSDCRNYWYNNLFYINNMYDHSQCILQTWYLACDMQLHIVGMLVLLLAPRGKARWWVLGALYTVGVVCTGYHVYTKDLEPMQLSQPSVIVEFFIKNPTFNYNFKRTYVNLNIFVVGMSFGYLVSDWKQKGFFQKDYTKYRYLYWLVLPTTMAMMSTAGPLFYDEGPRASIALRLVFGPVVRTLFVIFIMCLILGTMCKIDNLYRGIIEWKGWMPISRLGFCIFSIHMTVIRYLGGTQTTLEHYSDSHVMLKYAGITTLTVIASFFLYMFVEAPFASVINLTIKRQSAASPNTSVAGRQGSHSKEEVKNKNQ